MPNCRKLADEGVKKERKEGLSTGLLAKIMQVQKIIAADYEDDGTVVQRR